jgi:lysophospholipase L1-like esterase
MPVVVCHFRGKASQTVTSYIPEVGAVFAQHPSTNLGSNAPTWLTSSDRAWCVPTSSTRWGYWATSPATAQFDYCFELKKLTNTTFIAPFFRMTAVQSNDGYDLLINGTNNAFQMRKWSAGSVANQDTSFTHTISSSSSKCRVRVTQSGNTMTMQFLDGVTLVATKTDGSSTGNHAAANYCGLGYAPNSGEGSASAGYHFRHFCILPAGTNMIASDYEARLGEGALSLTFKRLGGTAWTAGVTGLTLTGSGTLSSVTCTDADTITATFDPGSSTANLGDALFTVTSGGAQTCYIGITRTIPTIVATNDSTFLESLSPGAWYLNGATYIQTPHVGNGFRGQTDSPYYQLLVDPSPQSAVAAGSQVTLSYCIGGKARTRRQQTQTDSILTLMSGKTGTTAVDWMLEAVDFASGGDPYTGVNVLRVTGCIIAGNSTLSSPTTGPTKRYAKKTLAFGDSKLCGTFAIGLTSPAGNSASASVAVALRALLRSEVGVIAQAGMRYTAASGYGTWPAWATGGALGKIDSGHNLDTSVVYDYIFIDLGVNDEIGSSPTDPGSVVTANLNSLYASWPAATYIVMSSGGSWQTSIFAAAAASNVPTAQLVLVPTVDELQDALGEYPGSTTPTDYSLDGLHPTPMGAAVLNSLTGAALIEKYTTGGAGVSRGRVVGGY